MDPSDISKIADAVIEGQRMRGVVMSEEEPEAEYEEFVVPAEIMETSPVLDDELADSEVIPVAEETSYAVEITASLESDAGPSPEPGPLAEPSHDDLVETPTPAEMTDIREEEAGQSLEEGAEDLPHLELEVEGEE